MLNKYKKREMKLEHPDEVQDALHITYRHLMGH